MNTTSGSADVSWHPAATTGPTLAEVLAQVRELVECESPSHDDDALARSAAGVAALGTALLGVAPERVPGAGHHLMWRFGDHPRVLLLGHHDTVWPIGSWERTWSEEDDRISGPGCFDMKAGLVIALQAVATLTDRDGVVILVNSDEEIGSPTSRGLVAELAAQAGTALVFEASAPGGAVKTARRGNATYRVEITGVAAHAGLEPERGVNAAVETAHQVLAIQALAGRVPGTSVVPSMLSAGTTSNT
ncbi:MAG: M20/M25/M40 family metallo-hydrolase, partial [Cellulomonadaceae bacterium]